MWNVMANELGMKRQVGLENGALASLISTKIVSYVQGEAPCSVELQNKLPPIKE